MKKAACPSRLLILLPVASLIVASACAGTIIITRKDNRFEFISAEQIQINGKDRIRLSTVAPVYTPRQVNQFTTQRLTQTSLIQMDLKLNMLRVPSPGTASIVLPDADKTDGTYEEMWTRATIGISKSGSKQFEVLPAQKIWAILQGSSAEETLAQFISDDKNFQHPDGASESRRLQGQLIAASLAAFPNSVPMREVRSNSEKSLRSSIDKVNSGLAEMADLMEAREKAKLSALVYPSDPPQAALRARLEQTEVQLKETQAILKAFEIASLWDPFLAKYRAFQRYEFIFPEFQDSFRKALGASRDEHKRLAQERQQVKDCASALTHYRVALRRDPADLMAREQAESARVCLVRSPRAARSGKKGNTEAELAPAFRTNEFVIRFIKENKLESAEKALNQGLQLYPDFPPLLLSQARWLERRNQLRSALGILDRYDSLVSSQEEWNEGDKARRDIEFQILKSRDERGKKLLTLINEYRFATAMAEVVEGLNADDEDQELLFRGGILKMMLRERASAKTLLQKYLDASQSLSGVPARRKQAFALISSLDAAPLAEIAAADRRGNWFSQNSIPQNLFYDPASLAFNRRIEHVELSQKQGIDFMWSGERLDGIQRIAEEKPPRTIAKFRFEYLTANGSVRRVFDTSSATPTAAIRVDPTNVRRNLLFDDPVAQQPGVAAATPTATSPADLANLFTEPGLPVLMANHPNVDIPAVERLTGIQLGHTVTGNRYFQPFVWERPYSFRLSYDDLGRAIRAYPAGTNAEAAEIYVFAWDGLRLTEISIHPALANLQPDRSKTLYKRTMNYSDGQLHSERIENPTGKPVRIEYKYQNGVLTSVDGEADSSLGNHSFKAKISSR